MMDVIFCILKIQTSTFSSMKDYPTSSGIYSCVVLQPYSAQCCEIFDENSLVC